MAVTRVSTDGLADSAVNSAKIGVDVITDTDLANNSVTANEISNNAVTSNKIAANAVTSAKLDTNIAVSGNLDANVLRTASVKHTNNTTAMTIDSSGNTTMNGTLKSNGGYELIASKVSGADNQLANSSVIEFQNVFSNAYIQYKVIIGWYCHAGNSGENVELRFMTGTNTQVTDAHYRYHLDRGDTGNGQSSYNSNSGTKAIVFRSVSGGSNEQNVGCHGELTLFNIGDTTLGGTNTARVYGAGGGTGVYTPMLYGTMCGFSIQSSNYERQDVFCRLNTSAQDPYHYTGFCFLTPASGESKGTHIAVYGMRSS